MPKASSNAADLVGEPVAPDKAPVSASAKTSDKAPAKTETVAAKKPAVKKPVAKKPAAKTAEKPVTQAAKPVAQTEKSVAEAAKPVEQKAPVQRSQPQSQQKSPQRAPRPAQNGQRKSMSGGFVGGNRRNGNNQRRGMNRNQQNRQDNRQAVDENVHTETIRGVLDASRDGHGVLRAEFSESDMDAYISTSQLRRFKIMPGDMVTAVARKPKDNERYWGVVKVETVNDLPAEEMMKVDRPKFKRLTPVYPDEQIKLETGQEPLDLRIIDMVAPIGKGQRSLLVSPPKAGKTSLLKNIATGVAANNPEIHLIAVLVGERPEEVTDIKRHIESITKGKGEVAASNFDESAQSQVNVAETALERAKRMVEMGKDVMILLDSITRLARAYNLAMPTSGRTLSGGFDPAALFPPKKFFGAARNFEVPGSLTIVGTALVDTGSRMDDLVYEEFKGTGNQEVHLSRRLAERRIYPAIDVQRSGTRRDDLMIDPMTYQGIATLHRMLDTLDKDERTSTLMGQLGRTKSNKEFLASLKLG